MASSTTGSSPRADQQRTTHDCVLCCLAMAVGLSYEEALQRLGELGQFFVDVGCADGDDINALEILGLKRDVDFKRYKISIFWCTQGFLRNILWGRRAMLEVRSRNKEAGWHAIYWDGTELRDPSNRLTYTDWNEVEASQIIVFHERSAAAT